MNQSYCRLREYISSFPFLHCSYLTSHGTRKKECNPLDYTVYFLLLFFLKKMFQKTLTDSSSFFTQAIYVVSSERRQNRQAIEI